MRKIAILFLILFMVLIYSANSLKTFEIDETEKLSLGLKTDDPDADKLAYTFTEPLDENGEWQTDYGDAGEYNAAVSVSDGVNEATEEVLIIVHKKEEKPVIDEFSPKEDSLSVEEGGSISFKAEASDLNNDLLFYEWLINGKTVSDKEEITFKTGYDDSGSYKIILVVSDGVFNASREWDVNVDDVNIGSILGQIGDVAVVETEKASIELPDLKKYGLSYTISEPIGDDNVWKTDYDDEGEYKVKISVHGQGFEGEEEVIVTVENKDRAPEMLSPDDVTAKENEQVSIELKAVDPDNDEIIFSAENAPPNSNFEGNTFTWKPDYDFVQKNNFFGYVMEKFGILSRSTNIIFKAQSNNLSDEKKARITVKDVNRPFALEKLDDIEVNEGEQIFIDPKYNDPDNDKVSFSYSGFMDSSKKDTGFDDAGDYVVKVTASDGYHKETMFVNVKVNDVNRKPVFYGIKDAEVSEGDELRLELEAEDPDNDEVFFSATDLPKDAKLMDNIFVWTPDFSFANGTKKEFSIDFTVSDGKDEDMQQARIAVLNANQAPKIINCSNNLVALKDKETMFEVNAADVDGDTLEYNWDFGFLDKFEGTSQHQRIFTSKGSKEVKVTVSDGIESVLKVWKVEVV
ncbi:hypothetical protein KY347_02055 [Candidatus Woesearchaeota archaeon]|nr:hypothetical protein [Candidatus Woesearchaeota archaeon]